MRYSLGHSRLCSHVKQALGYCTNSGFNTIGNEGWKVRIHFRGKEFFMDPRTALRTGMLQNKVSPYNGMSKEINCRGLGTCGTCAVEVVSGTVQPTELTRMEKIRLNLPPHQGRQNQFRLRLSCQIRPGCIKSNGSISSPTLVLRKCTGFWGHNDEESTESADDFRLPLGQLEYIFDPNNQGS